MAALLAALVASPLTATLAQAEKALPRTGVNRCAAVELEPYVGKPVAALPDPGEGQTVRILAPNELPTADYVGTRLNVHTNDKGLIDDLMCG